MTKENRDEALERAGEVAKDIIAELDLFEIDYQSSIPTATPPTTRASLTVTESTIKSHSTVAQHMLELKKNPLLPMPNASGMKKKSITFFAEITRRLQIKTL